MLKHGLNTSSIQMIYLRTRHATARNNATRHKKTRHALYMQKKLKTQQQPSFSETSSVQKQLKNQEKNTLLSIIDLYKLAETKHANRIHYPHQWQLQLYNNIVHSNTLPRQIKTYSMHAPANMYYKHAHN